MNKVIIEIETVNAAFDKYPTYEVFRILKKIADENGKGYIEDGQPLFDYNGNKVGQITIK